MTCTGGGPTPYWRPAYSYFMGWLHVSSLLCFMIGGLLYTVQMFSCAISWLFFKWPLSQGMAGQHMETSALTIFLSKQQMALLLSFWSGTKIPKAEVLVYIEVACKGLPEDLSPLTVALPADVFSATLIFNLFLPVNLLLQGILNFDSSSCDCYLIYPVISTIVPRFSPICHLLGSTNIAKEKTVELSVWVTSGFGHWIYTCHGLNTFIWEKLKY